MATKADAKKSDSKTTGSIEAVVVVPCGTPTPSDTILKTAITAVRDKIPAVYVLDPQITAVSDPKQVDKVQSREYTVTVYYDAVGVEGAEPVDVDKEIEKLTVPAMPDYQAAVASSEPAGPSDGPGNK